MVKCCNNPELLCGVLILGDAVPAANVLVCHNDLEPAFNADVRRLEKWGQLME